MLFFFFQPQLSFLWVGFTVVRKSFFWASQVVPYVNKLSDSYSDQNKQPQTRIAHTVRSHRRGLPNGPQLSSFTFVAFLFVLPRLDLGPIPVCIYLFPPYLVM